MPRKIINLSILLVVFWLINSGHYTPLVLSFGVASILLVLVISQRMNIIDKEAQPFHLALIIPSYYLWLLKELLVSNMEVFKHIWTGGKNISPTIATLKMDLKSDMGRVIYANSITLTPGTVTLDVTNDSITVHALVKDSIDALRSGDMEARVARLER